MPWRCALDELAYTIVAALAGAGYEIVVSVDERPRLDAGDVTVSLRWVDGPTCRQVQDLIRETLGTERYVCDAGWTRRADAFLCSGYTAAIAIDRTVSVQLRARLIALSRTRHRPLRLGDDDAVNVDVAELSGYERVLATLLADATSTDPRTLAPDKVATIEATARLLTGTR